MLLRCGLHSGLREKLSKCCDNLVSGSWSTAADDKERYKLLLKDSRVQQPMNDFFKKCVRARESAVLAGDAAVRDGQDGQLSGCGSSRMPEPLEQLRRLGSSGDVGACSAYQRRQGAAPEYTPESARSTSVGFSLGSYSPGGVGLSAAQRGA